MVQSVAIHQCISQIIYIFGSEGKMNPWAEFFQAGFFQLFTQPIFHRLDIVVGFFFDFLYPQGVG